jgi:hypothetical protein
MYDADRRLMESGAISSFGAAFLDDRTRDVTAFFVHAVTAP